MVVREMALIDQVEIQALLRIKIQQARCFKMRLLIGDRKDRYTISTNSSSHSILQSSSSK